MSRDAGLNCEGEDVISASSAYKKILTSVKSFSSEEVSLVDALHRYLASSMIAPIDLPVFDHSAMDGYALCHRDVEAASANLPASLKIVATLAAGESAKIMPLERGQAIRIMTGAPIPEGADAVIPFEKCRTEGSSCVISEPVKAGKHIRRKGEDVKKGEKVLNEGERITSRKIALLAALGVSGVLVGQKPRVSIISTGNELVELGQPLPVGKIYNSNVYALAAALQEIGIDPKAVGQSLDSAPDLRQALQHHLDTDVLITIGGVSAGDYDLVPRMLVEMGAEIIFHKLAIKPGKPLLFALYKGRPIFSLPGNPVSALVVFDRFVRPALLKMMGAGECLRPRRLAQVTEVCVGSLGKEDYLRATLQYDDGKYWARPAGPQGSAMLKTLADANGIIFIPETKDRIAVGESVEVELWEEPS